MNPNPNQPYPAPIPPYGQPAQYYRPDPVATIAGPVKVLGIFYIISGVLGVVGAVVVGLFLPSFINTAAANRYGDTHSPLPATMFVLIGIFIAIFGAALPLAGGYGLLTSKPWGRVLAIVNACLILLSIPFGTILGAFTLYYMLRQGAAEAYEALSLHPY